MKSGTKILAASAVLFSFQIAQAADVRAPYAPPQTVVPGYQPPPPPCFVEFHRFRDGYGPSLVRNGPEEVPVIRALRYENGRRLKGRVLSISTGPGTKIMLYNGRDFRRPMFEIGPGELNNLKVPAVDSYRIACAVPGPLVPAPPSYR